MYEDQLPPPYIETRESKYKEANDDDLTYCGNPVFHSNDICWITCCSSNSVEAFDRVRLDVMSQGLWATAGWGERDRRRDLRINVRQSQPTRSGWPLERELNSLCNALGTWPVEEDIGEQDCSTK